MPTSQNLKSYLFVDYVPAELSEGKTWYIHYYVKHPITKELIRKRNRVKPLKSITERRRLAKQMIKNINDKLASGWNPFFEDKNSKQFQLLFDAFSVFINRKKVELKDNNLRKDTYRTYNYRLNALQKFITKKYDKPLFCFELNRDLINEFLDHVRYNLGNSAKTRDNYLSFCVTLCNFLVEKNYIIENPCLKISKSNRKVKTRKVIPNDTKQIIFSHLEQNHKNFYIVCLMCYYCLVRRTEISKLKVANINFKKNILTVDGESSKNRRTQNVTIPNVLKELLMNHVKDASLDDYIFSADEFSAGKKRLNPDRITKEWIRLRNKLNFPKEIQWYSLKDTGITDLLKSGVPLISVRDQARHHSSKQTDEYTPRDLMENDQKILNAKLGDD